MIRLPPRATLCKANLFLPVFRENPLPEVTDIALDFHRVARGERRRHNARSLYLRHRQVFVHHDLGLKLFADMFRPFVAAAAARIPVHDIGRGLGGAGAPCSK